MIENYLDFAKGRRAYAIQEARRCVGKSLECSDEWMQGFYRGMHLALEFESRHWRTLQKDIEWYAVRGDTLAWIPEGKGLIRTILRT